MQHLHSRSSWPTGAAQNAVRPTQPGSGTATVVGLMCWCCCCLYHNKHKWIFFSQFKCQINFLLIAEVIFIFWIYSSDQHFVVIMTTMIVWRPSSRVWIQDSLVLGVSCMQFQQLVRLIIGDTYKTTKNNFITLWAENMIRTAYYMLCPWYDEFSFFCVL